MIQLVWRVIYSGYVVSVTVPSLSLGFFACNIIGHVNMGCCFVTCEAWEVGLSSLQN
jgi:hypothetical protein